MDYSLTLEHVYKSFGSRVAVNDMSIRIPQGSIYGFLGPNGAGKTTTIRMIMSILRPDRGDICLLGSHDTATVKHRLGYLPEEKGLYKKMRARELIAYFGRLKGMPKHEAFTRADALLTRFGLGDARDRRCDSLSKGMGQKVQILATILHEPEFVILDEPFSGLDPINVELIRGLILDLKRQGRTVVISTHVMEQAEQICDYVLLINHGNKLLDGTLDEVKNSSLQTIQVEVDGDLGDLTFEGVTRINNMGRRLELSVSHDANPQTILKALMQRVPVREFTIREPSLHEVFVRTVGSSNE